MRLSVLCSGLCILCSLASAQWELDVRLTTDPANSFLANPNNHPLCVSGDSVYAVFTDDRTGTFQVYFTRSWDAGTTWDSTVCLTADSADILYPALAVSGALVHVAWPTDANTAIKYRRSTDGGTTWSAETTLTTSARGSGDASLAAEGNTVGMAWGDSRDGNWNGELYYKQSSDGGGNWTTDTRLTVDTDSVLDKEACLRVSGSYRYIVWTRSSWVGQGTRVWRMRSTDNGTSWEPRQLVTADTTIQNQPMVTAAGANVHVCWWDGRPDASGIYYCGSNDNGVTWNTERYLCDTTYGSDYPCIAAAGGNVYVAFRAWPAGQFSIGYCGSTDNGQTWSAETTLTTAAGMGTSALAAAGSGAHLTLYDNRDGNFEIYYKRNLTAGGLEERENSEVRKVEGGTSIVHGVLHLQSAIHNLQSEIALLDISGRKVLGLAPGPNDISGLTPGVYFVREPSSVGVRKVVLTD